MSKHKYTNYSKMADTKPVEPEMVEEVVQPVESSTVFGIVSGCEALNVRREPNRDSDVLCQEMAGSILAIEPENSTEDWYAVYTEEGIEGFCMKQYITLRK